MFIYRSKVMLFAASLVSPALNSILLYFKSIHLFFSYCIALAYLEYKRNHSILTAIQRFIGTSSLPLKSAIDPTLVLVYSIAANCIH